LRLALSVIAICGLTCVTAGSAAGSRTLVLELRGFGQSMGLSPACPNGLTRIAIVGSRRHAFACVLTARKLTRAGLDPWRIIETVRVTTQLPGGTIRSRETQTFTFAQSLRSTASFLGRVVVGTGRFNGATGAVSGGGKGRNGLALARDVPAPLGGLRAHSGTLA
jgi:hypothetical protein